MSQLLSISNTRNEMVKVCPGVINEDSLAELMLGVATIVVLLGYVKLKTRSSGMYPVELVMFCILPNRLNGTVVVNIMA